MGEELTLEEALDLLKDQTYEIELEKANQRFQAALQILVHNISPSMREQSRVEEAVKLGDMLIAELERTKK